MPWVGGSTLAAEMVKNGYKVINAPWGVKNPYFDPYLVNGAQLKKGETLLLGATSLLWESPQEAAAPYLRTTGALRNEPAYNPNALRTHVDFLMRLRSLDATLDRYLYGFTFRADGLLDPRVFMRAEALFAREATLELEAPTIRVRYTTDGSEPIPESPRYTGPFRINSTTTIKARVFPEGDPQPRFLFERTYRVVPALKSQSQGARVTYTPKQPGYAGPGPQGLIDGYLADGDEAGSAGWIGWERCDKIEVTLDLGKPAPIANLGIRCLRAAGGIDLPRQVQFSISETGESFRPIETVLSKESRRGWYRSEIKTATARYVRATLIPNGDWTFVDEFAVNPIRDEPSFVHEAMGKPVKLVFAPSEAYNAPGIPCLTDGFVARSPDFLNPFWLGFESKNLDATIDLGKSIDIREVGGHFLQYVRAGIYMPHGLEVHVSDDGKAFRNVATIKVAAESNSMVMKSLSVKLKDVKGRYVRVVANVSGQWLFVDEIFVNPTK
jgi:hypothetical protein